MACTIQVLLCTFLGALLAFGQKGDDSPAIPPPVFEAFASYKHQNNIGRALETLDSVLKIAEVRKDTRLLLDTYHHYTQLFLEEGDWETAAFYWDRASLLLQGHSYPYGQAFHYYIEAMWHYKEEKLLEALTLLEKSRALISNHHLRHHILLLEASLYTDLGRYKEALNDLQALTVDPNATESPYLAAQAALQWGKIRHEQGDCKAAITHSKTALTCSEEHGFLKVIQAANAQLSHLYEKLGHYDEALRHRKALEVVKDSLFTLKKAELVAKTTDRIRFVHQRDAIVELTATNKALSESKDRSELTAILASAFLAMISLLAASLYRNNQIKLKTNALLHTKNKELKLARDAAVSASKAKTNFLSTVSHELRTPLYAVTGLTHLLLEENPAEHQKEHLKSLEYSGEYLLNLINDILQINKIEADKLEPLSIAFNLQKVLAKVIDALQQKARENQTSLLLEYDPNIPKRVLGDPIKLSQVFVNLVSNAIKFTKNGKVTLTAKLIEREENHVMLYFEVEDNGIGISREQQYHIFDSFEQGSLQINREYGGTGLGLAIVKSLLGLFGSTIHLESELGKGSSFFFEITLQCDTRGTEQPPPAPTSEPFDVEGLYLLVVEDNKINQIITKKMLAQKAIRCDIANNGEEAIAMAQTHSYDAILMDIHMPGISGEEATRHIRTFDQNVPIIALTAISLDDSVDSFYEAGCDTIITKPFKPEVFYRKIGETIAKKKGKGLP